MLASEHVATASQIRNLSFGAVRPCLTAQFLHNYARFSRFSSEISHESLAQYIPPNRPVEFIRGGRLHFFKSNI